MTAKKQDHENALQDMLQSVFVGTYEHLLDPKKRLTIPADWREQVGEPQKVYVLPGINAPCLCVFPAREMAKRLERIRSLSIADDRGRNFLRTIASRSDFLSWDAQGRIRVKDELLDGAGITTGAVLVGAFEYFELWSPEKWKLQQESSATSTSLGEAARYVGF
jgi:MraZ protein